MAQRNDDGVWVPSPTPWTIYEDGKVNGNMVAIQEGRGPIVAGAYDREDAERIVRCVNEYEALIDILERVTSWVDTEEEGGDVMLQMIKDQLQRLRG